MSLFKLIKKFNRKSRILFTTPSHNQGKIIAPKCKKLLGKKIFKSDFSEIEGFDNLALPEGAILDSQITASEIYQSKYSFYLPNGSTSGIIAAMLATLSENDKVLISRNCHKAVYNGLVLTGANPIWLNPKYDKDWDVFSPLKASNIENSIKEEPNIKALIITNPTYEGIISDISKIADICTKNNITLIVDEAHGALWNFDKTIGTPGIYQKADITIQSLHKTAGALNPSAIMHIGKESTIELDRIQDSLNLINTTSPSYPVLLNIEGTIDFLNSKKGKNEISKLTKNIYNLKKSLSKYKNIHIYNKNNDITKIFIKIEKLTGFELSDILFNKYKIEDELANEKAVLCLTGMGTPAKKLNKLKKTLIKISKKTSIIEEKENIEQQKEKYIPTCEPETIFTPKEAYNKPYKTVNINECVNKVSKEIIIKYPPGIPILLPGEKIKEEHLSALQDYQTIKIIQD